MASVSTSYARIADRYEQVRGGEDRADVYAPHLDAWLPRTGRTCDVGCGTRIITERLQRPDRQVVGIDISHEMLAQAPERLAGRRARADAMALPFADASLDGLSYMWVLHHVGDLDVALSEARRVLRPGARLVTISGTALPGEDDMSPFFENLQDRFRPGQRDRGLRVGEAGVEAGFVVVHDDYVACPSSSSPNELADNIADGLFSFTWDLSDEEWREHVEPTLGRLRALPDPHRQRERVFRNPIVVLERPT